MIQDRGRGEGTGGTEERREVGGGGGLLYPVLVTFDSSVGSSAETGQVRRGMKTEKVYVQREKLFSTFHTILTAVIKFTAEAVGSVFTRKCIMSLYIACKYNHLYG